MAATPPSGRPASGGTEDDRARQSPQAERSGPSEGIQTEEDHPGTPGHDGQPTEHLSLQEARKNLEDADTDEQPPSE
ncbi:MAG TPA: hypothetical protein VIL35_08965 [Vicinamibacterales bacterium]